MRVLTLIGAILLPPDRFVPLVSFEIGAVSSFGKPAFLVWNVYFPRVESYGVS